ncbi:tyrosine-protein kinase Wzc [Filimonas lacunae]|nr:tyrosine-protein kinase Wzc [Filimonas lacunae]
MLEAYSEQEKQEAILEFTNLHKKQGELLPDSKLHTRLYDLVKSMKYDEGSIRNTIQVYRVSNSDYIDVESESENADLSAFIANTVTSEFISIYAARVAGNRTKTSDWLYRLLMEKLAAMNAKMEKLKNYKIQNHILNLQEQAKALYGQISDFETRREVTEREIVSTEAALQGIENKFSPKDRKYLEGTMTGVQQEILVLKDQLKMLNQQYVTSNFNQGIKLKMDSLRNKLGDKIAESSDKYIYSPLSAKTELVSEKLKLEVALDLSKNSVSSISNELTRLNSRLYHLVPHEAMVQSFETDIDVASREYLEILNKWNEFNMGTGSTNKLKQVEMAIAGPPQPSKKMLLVILSGVISFVFCTFIIFILFMMNNAIEDGQLLANKTGIPVLGTVNLVKRGNIDLHSIWSDTSENTRLLKNQLRALRLEIGSDLSEQDKILGITSLEAKEGKTFLAVNLAYAWSVANSKVLLIDGNFSNPAITNLVKPATFIEDYLSGKASLSGQQDGNLTILGNRGGDASLMEIADRATIQEKLQALKQKFDFIIIDTATLDVMDNAKEWLIVSDKTVAVFESGKSVSASKKEQLQYLAEEQRMLGWIVNKA